MLEIQLSAGVTGPTAVSVPASYLDVSGGSLRIGNEFGTRIHYAHGQWRLGGRDYRSCRVSGRVQLAFGHAREPMTVSDPIEDLEFIGPLLGTAGVGIARYSEHQNTWYGLLRPMWWVSMRFLDSDAAQARGPSPFNSRTEASNTPTSTRSA